MGDYNRSTREVSLADFSSETRAAFNQHIELYDLGPILDDVLICVESISEKIKKGLFSGPGAKVVINSIVLTPGWLLQVVKLDNDAAFARSARLTDIVVADYEKGPLLCKNP